jgi:hypothetical protein
MTDPLPNYPSLNSQAKLSKIEGVKDHSRFLLGPLGTELADENPNFGHDSEVLLKFHGTYQQDDRDERGQVSEDGAKKKSYSFMVRTKHSGRQADQRPDARRARPVRRTGQHHAPHHHPAGLAAPRRAEEPT